MSEPAMNRQVLRWQELAPSERHALLERPAVRDERAVAEAVDAILARVRRDGDAALYALTEELDGARLDDLRVDATEFDDAERVLGRPSLDAIEVAIANVRRFHEAQLGADISIETTPGVRCERLRRPIDAVGLYVPAGSAPLPSAAVMLTVPADIAGCRRRLMCTPPRRDGRADPAVLAAARLGGVTDVYKVGGAQAIAALAFGTESIAAVDKIFGPGNAWVTAAKSAVARIPGGAAIDLPAGPSEVMVIADGHADARYVAADLLSQAEHGPDSQVMLLTTSEALATATLEELDRQLETLARRPIAARALANSRIVVAPVLDTLLEICNRYAPEHLIVQVENPRSLLPSIRNAGSVFLGPWTPESVGDYCSGTNHVLPTYGAARSSSGLGVEHFMRQMTVQELSRDGLEALSPTVTELATLEGLDAHAAAVRIRLNGGGSGAS